MNPDDATTIVTAAARGLAEAALRLIEADPHQWSKRPCPTCSAVSVLVGRPFGCDKIRRAAEEIR